MNARRGWWFVLNLVVVLVIDNGHGTAATLDKDGCERTIRDCSQIDFLNS